MKIRILVQPKGILRTDITFMSRNHLVLDLISSIPFILISTP